MATAKKLTRKALKRPDEFQQKGRTAVEWITEHGRLVGIVSAVAVVVGVGIALTLWTVQHHAQTAADALGDALSLAQRPVTKTPPPGEKAFPTKDARDAAYRKALEGVRKDHAGTAAAAGAALQLGNLDFSQKHYDAAVKAYQDYLSEAAKDAPFRFAALEGIGLAYEAKGENDKALAAYKRLVAEGNAFFKPFALVREARVLVALGKPEAARSAAQKVLDDFATSPAHTAAEQLLDGLPPAPETGAAKGATAGATGKKQEG